jgi:hypothetical protein
MSSCFEGKSLRVRNDLRAKVDVQLRPVVMAGGRFLDVEDLGDRRILEPGELLEGQKRLLSSGQDPNAVA